MLEENNNVIDQSDDEGYRPEDMPDISQLEAELIRFRRSRRKRRRMAIIIAAIVVVVGLLLPLSVFRFPRLYVSGRAMIPTLQSGDVVLTRRKDHYEVGDIVSFTHEGKLLLRRVIAVGGQSVDIDANGRVYIDGDYMQEDYLPYTMTGSCEIELPYMVPEGSLFLMADNRSDAIDSRSESIGAVSEQAIEAELFFRISPFERFGDIHKTTE